MNPHQQGNSHPRLLAYRSSKKGSSSCGERIGSGVRVGVTATVAEGDDVGEVPGRRVFVEDGTIEVKSIESSVGVGDTNTTVGVTGLWGQLQLAIIRPKMRNKYSSFGWFTRARRCTNPVASAHSPVKP